MKMFDVDALKSAASDKWNDVLSSVAGIPREVLDGLHHPCPKCGGTDRFRAFTDGSGGCFCNQCLRRDNGDGLAVIRWFTGWTFPEALNQVADYLNMEPVDSADADTTQKNPKEKRVVSTDEPKKMFPTANAAVKELERTFGKRSGMWTYEDADGSPVGLVLRFDKPGGKTIRPVSKNGEGWFIGGMPGQRPLYKLSELKDACRVYVVEGEKSADAGRQIGLVCTTSPHGCQSPGKSDWSPLAGKEVFILPDNDEPGEGYASKVKEILSKVSPPPVVKVVRLPELPDKGDLFDFVQIRQGQGVGLDAIRAEVERLAEECPAEESPAEKPSPAPAKGKTIEHFQRFPVELLPESIRGFVVAASRAIGCNAVLLVLPLLAALGAAIGNSRRLVIKRGWCAPPIVWTVSVGESGTAKTPAMSLALKPVRRRQKRAMERHQAEMDAYKVQLAHYEKDLADWKRSKKGGGGDPPVKPEPPIAERFLVADTTVEGLAPVLLQNYRGVLLGRDELNGWIGSFDCYKGKGGTDSAAWLSMYNGESMVIDRRSGNPPTIFVPVAAVCVCGGIQPGILHRALGSEHRENGLMARLLLSCPPREPKKWTDADIAPEIEQDIERIFDNLYSLEMTTDASGDTCPVFVGMSSEAKAIYQAFYAEHNQEQADMTGDLSAAWSKLEEIPARLALIFHCVRGASGSVDAATMRAAVEMTGWFKQETRRVYALLGESEKDREHRQLIETIRRKGGRVTARELMRASRKWATSDEAEAALNELAKDGHGQWESQPASSRGGQPTRVFILADSADADTTPNNPWENEVVSTDSMSMAGGVDEWGVV